MSEQQQADDLARKLDEALGSDQTGEATGGNPLVVTALRLASAPHPSLSSDAMARLQAQVTAAADQQKQARKPVRSPLRLPRVVRWAAAACLALAIAGGLVTPATANSVPGDTLYPLKQAIERVETALAASPESQIYTFLTHAERRTQELLVLLDRSEFDAALVAAAASDLTLAAQAASRIPEMHITASVRGRAAQIVALLAYTLETAGSQGIVPQSALASLEMGVAASREAGVILLPPVESVAQHTVAPTASAPQSVLTPTATFTPSATYTPTAPYTPTPTVTPTATYTVTPLYTPTATSTSTPTFTFTPSLTPESAASAVISTDVETTTATATPERVFAYVNAERGANVRSGPGTTFSVVTVASRGSRVEIIGVNEDETWTHVRLDEDVEGWIAVQLLRATSLTSDTSQDCQLPGRACQAPGHTGERGNSGNGNSDQSPGNSGSAPGQTGGLPPGKGGTPPGQNP